MAESPQSFAALLVEETAPGQFTRRVARRTLDDLPAGEVLVRVKYSSLNYKDALSASGNKGVTRNYPHIPGIDAAGVVVASQSDAFRPGDAVIAATGELGVNTPGGFGEYIRTPAAWLLPLPEGLSLRQCMAYGAAGFTAALCVDRLQRAGVTPGAGEVLVTGATGGVGSIAVGILAKEGYHVVAATGKAEYHAWLRALGAAEILNREAVNDTSGRPLLHARWAGVVDTVGGGYLSTALRATRPGGVVTACGNAASPELSLTVYPFILRGVSLIGIDALLPDRAERERLWQRLAGDWALERLEDITREVTLADLDAEIQRILAGGQAGRVVVNMDPETGVKKV
jgi:putative YhdH/YhfP family quinone oxidoreductase